MQEVISDNNLVLMVRRVEKMINRHPAVEDAIVVTMNTPEGQQSIKAFIELGDTKIQPEHIIAYYHQECGEINLPLEVVFKDIPRTASGKVIRQQLLCS